jgi:hypothetical protein|tara:strand:- start:69 stop:923 length:855 start_codon:yes stop_codon:yes gene_type:complete
MANLDIFVTKNLTNLTVEIQPVSHTTLLSDYGFNDNSTNWDIAYNWGNHTTENYSRNIHGNIVSLDLVSGTNTGNKFVDGTDPLDAVYMDGNVGVGVTDPDTKLSLSTTDYILTDFLRSSGSNAFMSIRDATTSAKGFVGFGANGNDLLLRSGNTDNGRLDASGNLNIQGDITGSNLLATNLVDFISGLIQSPTDSSYKLIIKAPYAGRITETTTESVSGTCTATFKINTTALGGTANSVSSTEESQAHVSANAFIAGDDIVLTVSANATCVDMSFTIKFTKSA